MRNVIRLVWFDLKQELRPPVWIMLEWLTFTIQLFVYGAILATLVNAPQLAGHYQQFYAVGFVVMMTFDIGAHTGRHFVEHAHEGLLPYFLSLPMSRLKLFLAITLQGGAELAIMLIVPLGVTLFLLGNLTAISIVAAVAALFCLGFGIAGLMLGLSFIAFKSSDLYAAITTGFSAVIIRFSTVFYPYVLFPPGQQQVTTFSPLTYGADLIHLLLGFDPKILLDPTTAVAVIVALAVCTIGLSVFLLGRLVEGVKSG